MPIGFSRGCRRSGGAGKPDGVTNRGDSIGVFSVRHQKMEQQMGVAQ